jgi:hypothetical protein
VIATMSMGPTRCQNVCVVDLMALSRRISERLGRDLGIIFIHDVSGSARGKDDDRDALAAKQPRETIHLADVVALSGPDDGDGEGAG